MNNKVVASHLEEPGIHINSLTFNDGTVLEIKPNSIIVFVGGNNSGKSQALRDIESLMHYNNDHSIVISSLSKVFTGVLTHENCTTILGSDINQNYGYDMISNIINDWGKESFSSFQECVIRLDTSNRLYTSSSKTWDELHYNTPLKKMYDDIQLEHKVSTHFKNAFGSNINVNRRAGREVSLHVGDISDRSSYLMDQEQEYYDEVNKCQRIENQGDGMRSFASILMDTFTSRACITLIDEPEVFLHPPQIRQMGRLLSQQKLDNRQIFISTHSEDLIRGLIDARKSEITVIRLHRNNNTSHVSTLDYDSIKLLWDQPLLKFSNALRGLFYERVIICESDYDCLFFNSLINSMYEKKNMDVPETLFLHCGGKDRIHYLAKALVKLDVKVSAICDLDILHNKGKFIELSISLGYHLNDTDNTNLNTFYNAVNKVIDKEQWKLLKISGTSCLESRGIAAFDNLNKAVSNNGLFIIPYGVLERFVPTVNYEKKEWVYKIIEDFDLANDVRLENARKFINFVLDY